MSKGPVQVRFGRAMAVVRKKSIDHFRTDLLVEIGGHTFTIAHHATHLTRREMRAAAQKWLKDNLSAPEWQR